MTRAPPGVDLSFLNEEEAKQIFQVLQRDSLLKRAEKERISKLHKKKEDATGLPGVTGEWFEEIQKRKFQNDADVDRMLKPPLTHRLRKAKGNDSTNPKPSKPQIPQAQKHASPSILGGLRTPFASLFSSFRKSRRQHSKSQQKEQQDSPRYDHFAPGAHPSSKVEEMAKTETCESPKGFDAKQYETMEDSTCTWNEQLENELLRVLGNLDDQLAQEQRQDAANRRTSTDYGFKASEINHYPSVPQANFLGGVQRNDRNMFLSDGGRTLRANDEHKSFFRPRMFYDTYLRRHHTEDYTYGDAYDRRCPILKRGHSTHSLGRSSEGSLQLPSGLHSSGFGHKDFMFKDAVSRSYSLSSLPRHESLTSIDQLSTASLQHPLERNRDFTVRNYHHCPRRTPLSSIVWNTPQSSECPLYPDRILRTQSLMELGPTFEDPCSPQDNARYEFYRSNINYRRAVPNTPHSTFIDKHTNPPCFDDRENYLLHQMERNSSKTRYRYPSFHGRMNLSRKSFPSGRTEEQLFRPNSHHCYNDEVFLTSDADSERIPTNLNDWQSAYAKKYELWQCENDAQSHVSEYTRSMDPEGTTNKSLLKHAEGMQQCPAYGLSVPKRQTEYAVQRQNLFIGTSQNPSKTVLKHFQAKKSFKTLASEEVRDADQLGKVDKGDTEGETLRLVPGQVGTNSPTESRMSPSANSSAADPQDRTSLKPLLPLNSQRQTKSTSIRDIENTYFSDIQNRNGQRNEFHCAGNRDLDQTPLPRLAANSTRTSILQSLHQRGHQSEALRAFMGRRTPDNTRSPIFSRGPEILANDELSDSCAKEIHRHNRFVRHATSNSIAGSPRNSPPKSPVTYYTLPRKSASIGGSVISEKLVSHPTRRTPFNRIRMGDDLERLVSDRIGNIYSNKGDNLSSLSPASSSLSSSPKDVTYPKHPQTKDYCLQLTQDPKLSLHATNTIASTSEKDTVICSPDEAESSMLSGCEGTDVGNPLKQYKTTSTVTVSIEEDNVKYHELISVYYTLPRKHPRMLCNLFLDDAKKDTDPSPLTGKPQPPQKKYDVRIGLAAVAFSSSLAKADTSSKLATTPSMQQNPNISDGDNKEDPIVESSGASQSQSLVHNREETTPTKAPALVISDRVTLDGPQGDPKPSETEDESTHAVVNVCIGRSPSPLKEGSKIDTPSNLNSLNSTNAKTSLENLAVASSAMTAKKESPLYCCPSTEPIARNNPHIPSSCLIGNNNQEGKYTTNPEINATVNSTKEQIRQSAEAKERVYRQCRIISIKGNELQPRNKSVRNDTDEALISETKVCSDFQSQTLQVDGTSTVHPVLQPNRSALEYAKTEQEEMPQNSLRHKISTNLHRTSIENQNFKDDVTTASQDLPDHSATENKASSNCTKDKASDIEKRKNRSSIKNKLAAMYKTSRKFSSKKSLSPRPHISNIFSQNDAPSLEISNFHSMLISPNVPQSFLHTGNENQNQNSLSDEFDGTMLDKRENRKSQTNKGPPLLTNEIRRPFTNLCNQKRESPSPRQSDKKTGAMQNSTVLFPKEPVSKLCSNSQARDESLENNNPPTVSNIEVDSNQKEKGGSNVAQPLFFPYSSEENSNVVKNDSKANICSLQKLISPTEHDHYQNIKQLNRLRNFTLPCVEPVLNPSKTQRERRFSETSYTQKPHDRLASGSNLLRHGSRYSRKFKSYSELLTCDENENWDAYDDSNRTSASRRVMYPSIEFGIFGKEQQQAFLDNIKRSLTEGRLWRPCLLKDSSVMRKQGAFSLNTSELLSSNFAEGNTSAEGSSPSGLVDTCEENPARFSDSDSDTTTDDEYYLTDNDKESEL